LEEEEFIAMSQRPNFYKEFVQSLAPQICGSEGLKKLKS
jgi:DNA replicative helicase MCM subunit Mcm2 (Cdc46/Mcm family)